MGNKAVIYARVSTKNQDEKNQMPDILKFIEDRGFDLVKTYKEKASAWKAGHQKKLSQLIKDASNGSFNILVIWSLDRLTREGPHKVLMLYKKLEDLGVTVISVKEPWTEAPSEIKPLLLAVMGWIAAQEAQRQSDRTKAGIARKKLNGGQVGRPVGSKDKKKRKTSGYKTRQARERLKRLENGD